MSQSPAYQPTEQQKSPWIADPPRNNHLQQTIDVAAVDRRLHIWITQYPFDKSPARRQQHKHHYQQA
jgi:hypothetical protein